MGEIWGEGEGRTQETTAPILIVWGGVVCGCGLVVDAVWFFLGCDVKS